MAGAQAEWQYCGRGLCQVAVQELAKQEMDGWMAIQEQEGCRHHLGGQPGANSSGKRYTSAVAATTARISTGLGTAG